MGIVMRLLNQFCLRQNEVKGSQQEKHKKATQEQGKNKTTKYALPRETYYTRRKVTVARLHPIHEDDALNRLSTKTDDYTQILRQFEKLCKTRQKSFHLGFGRSCCN